MSTTEKWYDQVRDHHITRIEETLNTLKNLHAAESNAETDEELEKILEQRLTTAQTLEMHTRLYASITNTRHQLHTKPGTGDEEPQKTYTYRYTAEPAGK